MEINLLVIGIGNSRLHAAAFVAGEIKHVRHLSRAQQADWPALLAEIWEEVKGRPNAEVAGASVVPDIVSAVESAVREATGGQAVEWVGADLDLPIAVTTREPKQTGVDRVLVTAAAYEQLKKACVVVDAGTCVTVNLCNNEGALVGGAILPGVSLMADALHSRAAQLPAITYAAPDTPFGADTAEAINHGITGSIRGLVQSMAERWAEEMGTWPEVIATGGDAAALFDGWEIVHAISPDLLMYGIALAYAEHHIRHAD